MRVSKLKITQRRAYCEFSASIPITNATQRVYIEALAKSLGASAQDRLIKRALEYCLEGAERCEQVAWKKSFAGLR